MGSDRQLWIEYRTTWQSFAQKLDLLQELAESGDRGAAAAAFIEVEKSRLRYNAARDRLADHLAGRIANSDAARTHPWPPVPEEHRVRETARLLWEFSGKPEHTAESDWHRAEELVRSVCA